MVGGELALKQFHDMHGVGRIVPANNNGQIRFRFDGGSNLDPSKDMHMHEATLTIVDDDHIEVDGVGWVDGAPAEEICCGLKLVRKK